MSAESNCVVADFASSEKQSVLKCDVSEHAAGYVLTDDFTDEETGEPKKFSPVTLGSERFTAGQTSLTNFAREDIAMPVAFNELGHILWDT